jgi:hypothetical protein
MFLGAPLRGGNETHDSVTDFGCTNSTQARRAVKRISRPAAAPPTAALGTSCKKDTVEAARREEVGVALSLNGHNGGINPQIPQISPTRTSFSRPQDHARPKKLERVDFAALRST